MPLLAINQKDRKTQKIEIIAIDNFDFYIVNMQAIIGFFYNARVLMAHQNY